MDVHDGTARDGVIGKLAIGPVQEAEATCPPTTPGVDVGPRGQQDVDHLGAATIDYRRRIKRADGIVDPCLHLGMAFEKLANAVGVAGSECFLYMLNGIARLGHGVWLILL